MSMTLGFVWTDIKLGLQSADVLCPRPQNLQIAGQLIDRVVGKNMSMTYDFQHLTIYMPKAEGAAGHMGNVQWTINGNINITCEAYEKRPG